MIRDIRNLSQTQKTLELDCSTGILMPLFDPDTNMLFLAGKGDTTILYMELTDREPYLIEGLRHSGELKKMAYSCSLYNSYKHVTYSYYTLRRAVG